MITLPSIYSSGMVLQRGVPLPIRGKTTPNTPVSASLGASTATVTSLADGSFLLHLPPQSAGGPHTLTLATAAHTLTVSDVLVGDVWLCSGQSNMEWSVVSSNNSPAELADANFPQLRLLHVPRVQSGTPESDVGVKWQPATSETAREFSAVGFFFARKIHRDLSVPVGIINSSWGGTTAESWTPLPALAAVPALSHLAARATATDRYVPPGPHEEPENTGFTQGWAGNDEVGAWADMAIPQIWQAHGLEHNGTVFFRREITLTAAQAALPATLSLGVVDDIDTTYVNNVQVGRVDTQTPNFWAVRRSYTLAPGTLRAGKNVITVRVFDQWGSGGICGNPEDLHLTVGNDKIPLNGTWRYRTETPLPLRSAAGGQPIDPCQLYNAMIHPLLPFPIRGALWYQGESNADRAHQYRTLLPTLIAAWRKAWDHTVFPFYIVQLANFQPRPEYPGDSQWAELREAQTLAQTALPHVYTISAIDVGDAYDIHPTDKQTVALRLANAALATSYHQPVPWQHPSLKSAAFSGQTVRVEFHHATGLHLRGDQIEGFQLCGEDRKWHWATAQFESPPTPSTSPAVLVSSPAVATPTALRYGWHENPPATLFNASNLPPLPFRTDAFPGITAGKI